MTYTVGKRKRAVSLVGIIKVGWVLNMLRGKRVSQWCLYHDYIFIYN